VFERGGGSKKSKKTDHMENKCLVFLHCVENQTFLVKNSVYTK
jgi:hypothetical protein